MRTRVRQCDARAGADLRSARQARREGLQVHPGARIYSLDLQLVAGPELTAEVESDIRTGILRRMGEGAELTIRRVNEIPPEKSGKYRYVVSKALTRCCAPPSPAAAGEGRGEGS